MSRILFSLFLCLLTASASSAFRVERLVQSVAVRGIFVCGKEPAVGVRVKLFEYDANTHASFSDPVEVDEYLKMPNHDDVLNETYTDQDGRFFVHGTALEVDQIEPILKVYHTCLVTAFWPEVRKIHFLVPRHFTNDGPHANRVLDLGTFNLEVVLPDEQREKYASR